MLMYGLSERAAPSKAKLDGIGGGGEVDRLDGADAVLGGREALAETRRALPDRLEPVAARPDLLLAVELGEGPDPQLLGTLDRRHQNLLAWLPGD